MRTSSPDDPTLAPPNKAWSRLVLVCKAMYYCLLLFCTLCFLLQLSATPLDEITFGDSNSESKHGLSSNNSRSAVKGGLNNTFRSMGPHGWVQFYMVSDPNSQTYLTVKFWGSETVANEITQQTFLFDGNQQVGSYGSDMPELDYSVGVAFEGRFQYSTYMIPNNMTTGKRSVVLKLGPPASDDISSRGVYRAYTHTDPFLFVESEQQGSLPVPAPVVKSNISQYEFLRREVDDGVSLLMKWQLYGVEWDDMIKNGSAPVIMTGAISPFGEKSLKWNKTEWKNGVMVRSLGSNNNWLRALSVFALAYHSSWSTHYLDQSVLDRISKGLDFYCVAQGANGGYDDRNHNPKSPWIGGPDRRNASGCLEGYGHFGLSHAFVLIGQELDENGYLDVTIDNDDNPNTPEVLRREAYLQLFTMSRDYLTSPVGRGHAPNQDMADIIGAVLANECVRHLNPPDAWSNDQVSEFIHQAVGLDKMQYGGYWVSPKGISMEPNGNLNGGYSGGYGEISWAVDWLDSLSPLDEEVNNRATRVLNTSSLYRYFDNSCSASQCFRCLRREDVTTYRKNTNPGRISYGDFTYQALARKDPVAIRQWEIYQALGAPYTILKDANTSVHFPDELMKSLNVIAAWLALSALPPSNATLPMEETSPDFAWADEMAGAVVVKFKSIRMYATFNYRRGFTEGRTPNTVNVNNITRIHYTTPTVDRIANIRSETRGDFNGLRSFDYGPFSVIMNSSPKVFQLFVNRKGLALDLISQVSVQCPTTITITPNTSMVLYFSS